MRRLTDDCSAQNSSKSQVISQLYCVMFFALLFFVDLFWFYIIYVHWQFSNVFLASKVANTSRHCLYEYMHAVSMYCICVVVLTIHNHCRYAAFLVYNINGRMNRAKYRLYLCYICSAISTAKGHIIGRFAARMILMIRMIFDPTSV